MDNYFFDETIANKIYNSSCDMDNQDYLENKESEIELINSALDKIHSYGCYNDDFKALYIALYRIYGE